LAFLLPTARNFTVFKFSRPVIFANLSGSRNKGHAKKRVLQYWGIRPQKRHKPDRKSGNNLQRSCDAKECVSNGTFGAMPVFSGTMHACFYTVKYDVGNRNLGTSAKKGWGKRLGISQCLKSDHLVIFHRLAITYSQMFENHEPAD